MRSPHTTVTAGLLTTRTILSACGLVAALMATGCSYSAREQYMAARSSAIASTPGDGSVRMAVWPASEDAPSAMAAKGGAVAPRP